MKEQQELIPIEKVRPVQPSILQVIANAAADPSVDPVKMGALIDLHKRVMDDEAKRQFRLAFSRLQPKLPVIRKDGSIIVKGECRGKFAKYESIQKIIKPLLEEEGFTLSFTTTAATGGGITVIGTLSHAAGHSEPSSVTLPADTSGSKNAIQAVGSTISYGKRYLTVSVLDIVVEDMDNDGASFGTISEEQARTIEDMLQELALPPARLAKFWQYAEAASVREIARKDYERIVQRLKELLGHK